jgi:cobaltochelatase CobS
MKSLQEIEDDLLGPILDKMLEIAQEGKMPQTELIEVETDIIEVPKENQALHFLRKSIDTPSNEEVRNMILKELSEYTAIPTRIDLTLPTGEAHSVPGESRHYLFKDILQAVTANIPVALIGPAGSGKSTCVEQIAKAIDHKFFLQNSVTGAHELTGYMDAHGRYQTTAFRECFEKGGLIFVDEADTSDAGAFKWINTAVANGYAMFPDKAEPVLRHDTFKIVIAANTYGTGADRVYVGANQLDASTLDRFVFFDFAYDEKLELALCGDLKWAKRVQAIRAAALGERARIVISPRASIYGAKLLKIGWQQPTVEARVIWKGIDPELKERILKKVRK